jgi:hypothetical protein
MMNQTKKRKQLFSSLAVGLMFILASVFIYSCSTESSDVSSVASDNRTESVDPTSGNTYEYVSVDTFITFDAETYEETIQIAETKATVYKSPDQQPLFPGCDDLSGEEQKNCSTQNLLAFVYPNIRYPKKARVEGREGLMVVKFIVGTNGKVFGTEFKRTIGEDFEDAIWDLINKMNQEITWTAGTHNGNNVDVEYILPVKFKFENPGNSIHIDK